MSTERPSPAGDERRRPGRARWGLLVSVLFLLGAGVWWVVLERERRRLPVEAPVAKRRPPPRKVVIVAVGDVMLDRGPGAKIRRHGPGFTFAKVRDVLADGDVRFGNLEAPISDTGPHAPHQCIFRASPRVVEALSDAGFHIVSLANNHALDAGRTGLRNTMTVLARNGIAFVGAAWSRGEQPQSVELRAAGLRLRFLAFTCIGAGDARLRPGQYDAAISQVRAAKRKADLLLVSVHWGVEYSRRASAEQRRLAHALVRAGADVVLGHHPHVLQGVEVLDGSLICYSMGNFVFDQRGRERMESAVFRISYDESQGAALRILPVWIPRATFAPQMCDATRAAAILQRMGALCHELDTPMRCEGLTGVISAKRAAPEPATDHCLDFAMGAQVP